MIKKVKKVGQRGTTSYYSELSEQNWAGDRYREYQEEKFKSVSEKAKLHTKRGTGSIKAEEIPKPSPRPSTLGMTRVTQRGTGSRKSRNKGSRRK